MRTERLRVRRGAHLDEERSDGQVASKRVLLGSAAHVARRHTVRVVVGLLVRVRVKVRVRVEREGWG